MVQSAKSKTLRKKKLSALGLAKLDDNVPNENKNKERGKFSKIENISKVEESSERIVDNSENDNSHDSDCNVGGDEFSLEINDESDVESVDDSNTENDDNNTLHKDLKNKKTCALSGKRKMQSKYGPRSKMLKYSVGSDIFPDRVTVFYDKFAFEVSKDDLRSLFKKSTGARVVKRQSSAVSQSFNFVKFATEKDLEGSFEAKTKQRISIGTTLDKPISMKENTLFVYKIPPDLTSDFFMKKFEGVSNVQMFEDLSIGENKGFCYVEFESRDMADKAFNTTRNGLDVNGTILEVGYASDQSNPMLMKGDTLHVRSLPEDVLEEDLEIRFKGVVATQIVKNLTTDTSRGFGFIKFESVKSAEQAHDLIANGLEINGKKIKANYALNSDMQFIKKRDTLFVGGISQGMEKDVLLEKFEGAIDVQIIYHRRTKKCAGYCFVKFKSEVLAKQAYESTRDGLIIDGKTLEVKFSAIKKKSVLKNKDTLFLRPIPDDMHEDVIRRRFDGIVDVRISKDHETGINKGFCHVEFETNEMAEKAYKSIKAGFYLNENKVEASFAKSRDKGNKKRFGSMSRRISEASDEV